MSKLMFIVSFLFLGNHAFCQSETQLTNEENNFIMLLNSSSKCEVFYGNGKGELIYLDDKAAKLEGIDAADRNFAIVTNKILSNGWKIESVSYNKDATSSPAYILFSRIQNSKN